MEDVLSMTPASNVSTMNTLLWIQQIFEAVIAAVSIIGNALVLYVIARNPVFHTVTNYLIGSLAMADLLVGLVGLPCVIINNFGLPNEFYSCLFMNSVIVVLTQISIFSLLLIAIERCLAVKFPIFHRQHLRSGIVVHIFIAFAWILGTVVGLVPMFGWHLDYPKDNSTFVCAFVYVIDMKYMVYFNFFGFVLSPLILMFVTYGYIYYVIHMRSKVTSKKSPEIEGSRKLSKESKAALRIFLVILLFTFCWLPIHIMNTITLLAGKTNFPVLLVGIFLSHANSAMNPFLYALTNERYNEAFKRALGFKKNMVLDLGATTQMD